MGTKRGLAAIPLERPGEIWGLAHTIGLHVGFKGRYLFEQRNHTPTMDEVGVVHIVVQSLPGHLLLRIGGGDVSISFPPFGGSKWVISCKAIFGRGCGIEKAPDLRRQAIIAEPIFHILWNCENIGVFHAAVKRVVGSVLIFIDWNLLLRVRILQELAGDHEREILFIYVMSDTNTRLIFRSRKKECYE
jgi:hypothetical protein